MRIYLLIKNAVLPGLRCFKARAGRSDGFVDIDKFGV